MLTVLYTVIIAPIELVVEFVFELLFRIVGNRVTNQGLAVIGVSLAISLLTLPLYRRADQVQQHERDMQQKLARWVAHIKKTFTGDERFMMLQTYYRENNYSPLSALNGSLSLLLEIPFFIAAYHFLSHLDVLKGARFGPIADLGAPDGLLHIGSLSVNLLPILMTAINSISAAIYLKGFPLKDKVQTYGMALLFLVLLYQSPAGLVVYWTCNNIFSLGKNIFYKLKNPRRVFDLLCAAFGTVAAIAIFASGIPNSKKKYAAVLVFTACTFVPLALSLLKAHRPQSRAKTATESEKEPSGWLFVLSGVCVVILMGMLIPSSVIVSSPAEFVDINDYHNPLRFLLHATCYAIGFFLLWAGVVYKMMDAKGKRALATGLWIFGIVALVNYMGFGRNLGNLSAYLTFDNTPSFSLLENAINLAVIAFAVSVCVAVRSQKTSGKTIALFSSLVLVLCLAGLSLLNIRRTQRQLNEMAYIKHTATHTETDAIAPIFTLSKTGKNVIVFMLDRAISGFFPMILEEKPILKEQFSGFTYYPNTISFGGHTIYGAPPLFGGYEYTPTAMNERKDKTLVEKHNEALKVMPVLFSEHGYDTTVCDVPFANYNWIPDLSIYDDYPAIKTHHTQGAYTDQYMRAHDITDAGLQNNERNFFCYSIFKIAPTCAQEALYDNGAYYSAKKDIMGMKDFIAQYAVLTSLPDLVQQIDSPVDTFLMIANDTTHTPRRLYLPDYTPQPPKEPMQVAQKYSFRSVMQLTHYHVNMAALLQLGTWFDYLKQQGVYDNTRIIIVSDHGYTQGSGTKGLGYFDSMLMHHPEIDVEFCNPLLLVKDFYRTELTTDNTFMTNADVPTLATKGIIAEPVNPFTHHSLQTDEKAQPQRITSSHHSSPLGRNYTTFDTSDGHWFSVHDNIFDEANWEQLD